MSIVRYAESVLYDPRGYYGGGVGEQLIKDGAGSSGFQAGDVSLSGEQVLVLRLWAMAIVQQFEIMRKVV